MALEHLKVKIKSLAEEARIIRHEEHVAHRDRREGLYLHRIQVVRPEARATLLAYGYMRGRAYNAIEQNPKTHPNWKRVARMVTKYGGIESAE